MNVQKRKLAGLAGVAAALVLGGLPLQGLAGGGHHHGRVGKLTGAWKVTVTTYHCETRVENPPFVSILGFAEGGVMTETTSNVVFQPGQRSPGVGSWVQTGPRTYWVTTLAFVHFGTPAGAPPPSFPFQQGTQRLEQGITMTGRNSWKSEATNTLTNAAGEEYFFGCARAVAQRID